MALMAKPYTWIILLLLPVATALLNFDLFGPQTLLAYFGYTFFAAAVTVLIAMRLLGKNAGSPLITLPTPALLFIALALFIFLHGLLTRTLNLTHYYWIANAAYFWAAGRLGERRIALAEAKRNNSPTLSISPSGSISSKARIDPTTMAIGLLYKGVSLLALVESLVVCLQELGMLPSKNPLYSCTGTWENPNVTAMFLALAIYAVLQEIARPGVNRIAGKDPGTAPKDRQKTAYMIAGFILLAIVLLKCRTAILVAVLFIGAHYWAGLTTFIRSKTRLSKWVIGVITGALCVATVLLLAAGTKRESTQGRIRIWETSVRLVAQKPITGQGFGRFEKQYNLFTANERLSDNDHVNMPYNDFLELGVEGGLGVVVLWAATLIALWMQHRKQGYSVLPIIALLLIQLTNFGFQALPVFALFLLYAAIPPEASRKLSPASIRSVGPVAPSTRPVTPSAVVFKYSAKGLRLMGVGSIQAIALFLSINQAVLANSFCERNTITKNDTGAEAIDAYADLASSLKGFVSYHLYFGDAYLKMKQYGSALAQYLQGLESSSNPDVLFKCGYCYQQLRRYDSSQYYYTLVENMQPYKFGPRVALLKLYQQQGDGPLIKKEAEEIVAMPVKVESNEVTNIKSYAQKILEKYSQL
jgi:O-antigen polymerase